MVPSLSSNRLATKSITKGDSERAQGQDYSGDIVALAAVSGAMESVHDSNVLLSKIFANTFGSSGCKSEDERHDRQAMARCYSRIPVNHQGQLQAGHCIMKENPTGREEQPAALNMLAVRLGARPSLGLVVRLVQRPM